MLTRHISFDVWNTLIRSNPKYGDERSRWLADHLGLEFEWVCGVYKRLKHGLDDVAEITGVAYDSQTLYRLLLVHLGRPNEPWEPIQGAFESIFDEFPPEILSATVDTLAELRERGFTLSIGSNTNFLSGRVIERALDRKIGSLFDFVVFSDLVRCAKPSKDFFDIVLRGAQLLHNDLEASQIMHVGDNLICDGRGAENAAMKFVNVTSPDAIPSILRIIQ